MYISTGESITVDVENLSKRLDSALGQVERTLTKAQKAAGLQIDSTGRLINQQGKLAEGLTLAQVKLGQYVDETGKIHTANGEFVADLNKIEQQLGFYADALGNVYNAQGDFIRQTHDAQKAAAEQAKAQQDAARASVVATQLTRKAFSDSLRGLAGATQQASALAGILAKSGGLAGDLAKKFEGIAKGVSIASQTFQGITDFASGVSSAIQQSTEFFGNLESMTAGAAESVGGLKNALGSLSPALSALGGPAGIAAAGVAAIGVGITAAVAATSETNFLSESFKEIETSANKAGQSIKSIGDALHFGALQLPLNDYDAAFQKIQDAASALQKAREEGARLIDQSINAGGAYYGGAGMAMGAAFASRSMEAKAAAEEKNAWAEYANEVKKLVVMARDEQKTEVDRLEEQKRAFVDIQARIDADEQLRQDAEARAVISKQIERLDEKILDAKNREADEAAKVAQAERERLRREAGIDKFIDAPKENALELTVDAYQKAVEDWTTRAEEFGLTQDQVSTALANYKKAVDDATQNELARKLKVDFGTVAQAELTLEQRFEQLSNALSDGIIVQEQFDAALSQLQAERARELDAVDSAVRAANDSETLERERAVALEKLTSEYNDNRINAQQRDERIAKVESAFLATQEKLTSAARSRLEQETGVKIGGSIQASKNYEERLQRLTAAFERGTITQNELTAMTDALKQETLGQLTRLSKLGIGVQKQESIVEQYNATVAEINDALKRELIDERRAEELRKQANEQRQARIDAENASARSASGYEAFIAAGEEQKSAKQQIEAAYEKIKQAADQGVLTEEELTKAKQSRRRQLEELANAEKEQARQARIQQRETIRSSLGVDSLMDELKTPLERYRETMDSVASAMKQGAINATEATALENKAVEEYWNALKKNTETAEKTSRKLASFESAKSMTSGSESLYLATVRNSQSNYQNRIQNTTTALLNNSNESVERQREQNALLENVVELFANIQTFNG